MSINVTKAYLPPLAEYVHYLEGIWERGWLTNNGPLVQQLEADLSSALSGAQVQFMSNGTIALQVAIKALALTGEIITTPFSYVATTTAILWEGCEPVFVDIEEQTFCIDATKIEAAITPRTSAILATHVYGYPCDVRAIEDIARRHHLKVIYDGAHAFGVTLSGGRSLLSYGDITTCSFHATKLFHTSEGGAIITTNEELAKKVWLYKSFGHVGDEYYSLGVNGKNSEFHAAMGLCNLPRVPAFIDARRQLAELYHAELATLPLRYPIPPEGIGYNYAYFPVVFEKDSTMHRVKDALAANGINTRRYFFPSLNQLPYHVGAACPVSEDISLRVLCLPFYQQLEHNEVQRISKLIREALAD
ncbi:DegT/DnrJ/EryC1/StrS family aminotransferase [Hymenobacter sp. UYCo722]|uniref:DegT/DnrJ/EryC1/StrS family aminotransferase n=1 Tax=Hymenobacter sp. UYCo722 TaxID=3156335 RepID=UPI003395D902